MDSCKVGNSIALLRKKYGMTQLDLAEKLQVTDKAVSRWERGLGTPDTSLLVKLSIILDVDVETLLEGNLSNDDLSWKGVLLLDYPKEIRPLDLIYTKRIIYLQISYFMLAGITEISIVGDKNNLGKVKDLVGNGTQYGIDIRYVLQEGKCEARSTKSITSALRGCTDEHKIMLVNGVDIIYGKDFTKILRRVMNNITIPTRMTSFEDKTTSIFFFPQKYIRKEYIEEVTHYRLERGVFCLTVADNNDLLDASNMIRILENHQSEQFMDINQIAIHRNLKRH